MLRTRHTIIPLIKFDEPCASKYISQITQIEKKIIFIVKKKNDLKQFKRSNNNTTTTTK